MTKSPIIYLIKSTLHDGKYHNSFGKLLNVGYERAIALDEKGIGYAVEKLSDYVKSFQNHDGNREILEDYFEAILTFPDEWKDESWCRLVKMIDFRKGRYPGDQID